LNKNIYLIYFNENACHKNILTLIILENAIKIYRLRLLGTAMLYSVMMKTNTELFSKQHLLFLLLAPVCVSLLQNQLMSKTHIRCNCHVNLKLKYTPDTHSLMHEAMCYCFDYRNENAECCHKCDHKP
jgi:hypothetical protein